MAVPLIITAKVDSPVYHAALQGLSANDHPQYALAVAFEALEAAYQAFIDDPNPLTQYVLTSLVGAANGIATLGPDGVLSLDQRPPESSTWVTATTTTMLGSDTASAVAGDFAAVTAGSQTYRYLGDLHGGGHTNASNWVLFGASAPVTSVDGQQGIIVLAGDGAAGTATKRTLGTGAQQAAPGNHDHDALYMPIDADVGSAGGVRVNGLWITGDSYADGAWQNRNWPEILRRMYGLPTDREHFPVQGCLTAEASQSKYTGIDRTTYHGSIAQCTYFTLGGVTGSGGNTRDLRLQFSGSASSSTGPAGLSGYPFLTQLDGSHSIPATGVIDIDHGTAPGTQLFFPGNTLMWASLAVSSGKTDGGGGAIVLRWQGGDYTLFARSGCVMANTDLWSDGVGELDQFFTHNTLRCTVNETKTPIRVNTTKVDTSLSRSALMIHGGGFNDLHWYTEGNLWKSQLRHRILMARWMMRYTCNDYVGNVFTTGPTITENANGGTLGSLSTSPYWGYLGQRRYIQGTGAVGGYVQYAIPADYNGEPLNFCFTAEPYLIRNGMSGTVSVGPNAGALTPITSNAGVLLDGVSSNAWTTHGLVSGTPRVTGVPISDININALFVDFRVTGLSPGAKVVRFTITNAATSTARLYLNGWAREMPTNVPQIVSNIPITPYMLTAPGLANGGDATYAAAFNAATDAVIAEFDDVVLADLYDLLSPGGTPGTQVFNGFDGVHPSPYGHGLIAEYMHSLIQELDQAELIAT